jgi:hypothetical protein
MHGPRRVYWAAALLAAALLLMILVSACSRKPPTIANTGSDPAPEATVAHEPSPETAATKDIFDDLEDFDPNNFSNSTRIDNEYFPLKPGMQLTFEGVTIEDGEEIHHQVIWTVTDLTKVIDGVRTVVVWDQDYSAGELVETELALFAQDDDGNVWHLGQYPEAYEEGKLVEAPAWIHGIEGARAGISMHAELELGGPSYSQGWGPAVSWTDRAQVAEMNQKVCVPFDCYENVLVTEEFSREELDSFQLKYYAPGVGNIRVGWKGNDKSQETLELVEFVQLSPNELAEVRASALELEKSAYEISKDVYGKTPPAELPANAQ